MEAIGLLATLEARAGKEADAEAFLKSAQPLALDEKGSLQVANTTKTAIVTGASRGIGAGLVEAFLKRGYNVVANSRNITIANPFSTAANVALVDGDIGDPRTAAKIVETAVSRFGRIDVLVNNAGVFIPKPFTE